MKALVVFAESLKYLKKILLDDAENQQSDIQLKDIKWIITVPAIWSDPFMRKAAVEVNSFIMLNLILLITTCNTRCCKVRKH